MLTLMPFLAPILRRLFAPAAIAALIGLGASSGWLWISKTRAESKAEEAQAAHAKAVEQVQALSRSIEAQNAGIAALQQALTERQQAVERATANARKAQTDARAALDALQRAPVPEQCEDAAAWLGERMREADKKGAVQ
jgi:hypothetical protein